jgi:hypothetical protein
LLIAALSTVLPALLFPTVRLDAQGNGVSHDLATAYVRMMNVADSQSTIDFVEGRVADNVAQFVHLPSTVRVLGTVVTGRTTYVLGTSSLAPDSVVRAIGAGYRAEHWDMLSPATGLLVATNGVPAIPPPGGFRNAPSLTVAVFCRDSTEVRASTAHEANATAVRLFVTRGNNNPCTRLPLGQTSTAATRPIAQAQPILPTLLNPVNANQDIQCFTIGVRSMQSNAQLLTSMDLPAFLEHYGKQLETQGWTASSNETPVLRKVWTRRDSTGRTQTATVTVSIPAQAQMCREAMLSISIPAR